MTRALAAIALVGAAGCWRGARARDDAPADAVITLYRDGALVEERHRLTIDADGVATVPIGGALLSAPELLVGVEGAELVEWSRVAAGADDAEVEAWVGDHAVRGRGRGEAGGTQVIESADGVHVVRGEIVTGGHAAVLRLVTRGARPGAIVTLHYATERLTWWTSYTLVEERDGRGRLHGALAIDNQSGRRWERARIALVDRPIAAAAEDDPPPPIRVPGRFALGAGEQRLDLGLRGDPLPLRPTLVYDPVGTRLDRPDQEPPGDPAYGVQPWSTRVDESVLIDLTSYSTAPLPAGVVRLLRVDARGQLAWRGEGKLLPPSTGARRATAISVGRAADVTGRRRRTMYERDEESKRLIEEFELSFANDRDRPVEVLAREHLYRGTCWTLSYASTRHRVAKEGNQQVGLGLVVPARSRASIVYRVTYTWDPGYCRDSSSPS